MMVPCAVTVLPKQGLYFGVRRGFCHASAWPSPVASNERASPLCVADHAAMLLQDAATKDASLHCSSLCLRDACAARGRVCYSQVATRGDCAGLVFCSSRGYAPLATPHYGMAMTLFLLFRISAMRSSGVADVVFTRSSSR